MEYQIALILYLLGAMFMTLHFEPAEGHGPGRYLFVVFFWPVLTVWFMLLEILQIGYDEEEE